MMRKEQYNGWTNQATQDMNSLMNNKSNQGQLKYLVKKFPEPFSLRIEMIEYFGYKPSVDYQQLAEVALESR